MRGGKRYFSHIDDYPLVENAAMPGWNVQDQGAMKILISSETGSEDLHLGIGWLEPGQTHLLHHHPKEAEFYYILEGTATVTVGEEVEQVRPGSVVYIPAGVSHSIVNGSNAVCVVLFGYNYPEYETIWD